MEARWPQVLSHWAHLVCLTLKVSTGNWHLQGLWMWAASWTSVRAQGHLQHHRPNDTAGPCRNQRSWLDAAPHGALAAPRCGLPSLRGGATVVGAPPCSAAALSGALPCGGVQACPGVLCHRRCPGQLQPAVALWMAVRAAQAQVRLGFLQDPARFPPGVDCLSHKSTL